MRSSSPIPIRSPIPQRDHRLAQAMLHRLATSEVGGQGEGRDELREPDGPPVDRAGHRTRLILMIGPVNIDGDASTRECLP